MLREDCHRGTLAAWWLERTGEAWDEFDPWSRTNTLRLDPEMFR